MLISLVYLFLQHLLPLLIFLSLFRLLAPWISTRQSLILILVGILFSLGLLELSHLSHLELLSMEYQRLVWLTLLFVYFILWRYQSHKHPKCTPIATPLLLLFLIICIHLPSFILHLSVLWSPHHLLSSMLVGIVLGAGISFSLVLMISIVGKWCVQHHGRTMVWIVLSLFMAGQFSYLADLLALFDLVPAQYPLWDSSHWIANRTEYGYILRSLFGYDATPTLWQLLIYVLSLTALVPIYFKGRGRSSVFQGKDVS